MILRLILRHFTRILWLGFLAWLGFLGWLFYLMFG